MIQFKSCVRCGGDVHQTRDWYGEYMTCLQCGWSRDISADSFSSLIESVQLKRGVAIKRAS